MALSLLSSNQSVAPHGKVKIEKCAMEAEMREAAITAVNVAMSRYQGLGDQCNSIQGMLEGRYNGSWCCIISENSFAFMHHMASVLSRSVLWKQR